MIQKNLQCCFLLVKIAAIGTCLVSAAFAKTLVPVFLFSGQSNMVGLGASASTAEQKKTVPNIKIDCIADNNKKSWTTLGPGFGGDASHFGPELFFGRALSDSMPDTKFAFIKDCVSGTYLGQSGGWLPPSSGGPGTLYKKMMTHIDNAMKSFNTAYDTTQYTPKWAGFIWHQGEFDGMDQSLANKYETNLTNLIKDIREKTGDDSLPIIIPMICGTRWNYKTTIQAAEVAVAKKTVNADTMSTEGYALADGIHYNGASMEKIGRICGQRWLAMQFTKNWWIPVPVVYQAAPAAPLQVPYSLSDCALFDLSGRKIGGRTIIPAANQLQRRSPTLVILEGKNANSGNLQYLKTVNLQNNSLK